MGSEEKEGDTLVVVISESRKTSSSSESEPELTQLKKGVDSGLLLEPVIRVQPPSPLPSDIDSNSSPEEGFQPIVSKQYTFKMEEETQEEPAKPTMDKDSEPLSPEERHTISVEESEALHSDPIKEIETVGAKTCTGHGCEPSSPTKPHIPFHPGVQTFTSDEAEEDLVAHKESLSEQDILENDLAGEKQDSDFSRVESTKVDCPCEESSQILPSVSHCSTSDEMEQDKDISAMLKSLQKTFLTVIIYSYCDYFHFINKKTEARNHLISPLSCN
uniref:Uncharacterized protein n=1 Tax=Monodelphis domestica TaxID=13616 RepID=A0A5F8GA35_MONDO